MSHSKRARRLPLSIAGIAALVLVLPAQAAGTGTITGTVRGAGTVSETVVYVVGPAWHGHTGRAEMDQHDLHFVPHMMTVVRGTKVEFKNHDHVNHDVFSPDHEGFKLGTFGFMQHRDHVFDSVGGYSLRCSIHPNMLAYVFVSPNPWAAVVGENGHFEIDGVPAGSWKLEVWNPHAKAAPKTVSVRSGGSTNIDLTLSS